MGVPVFVSGPFDGSVWLLPAAVDVMRGFQDSKRVIKFLDSVLEGPDLERGNTIAVIFVPDNWEAIASMRVSADSDVTSEEYICENNPHTRSTGKRLCVFAERRVRDRAVERRAEIGRDFVKSMGLSNADTART